MDLKSRHDQQSGWFANGSDFEWDLKYRTPIICNHNKGPPFSLYNLDKNTWILNGLDYSCSLTLWKPTEPIFKKHGFQIFSDFEWSDYRSPLYKTISLMLCSSVIYNRTLISPAFKSSNQMKTRPLSPIFKYFWFKIRFLDLSMPLEKRNIC